MKSYYIIHLGLKVFPVLFLPTYLPSFKFCITQPVALTNISASAHVLFMTLFCGHGGRHYLQLLCSIDILTHCVN